MEEKKEEDDGYKTKDVKKMTSDEFRLYKNWLENLYMSSND